MITAIAAHVQTTENKEAIIELHKTQLLKSIEVRIKANITAGSYSCLIPTSDYVAPAIDYCKSQLEDLGYEVVFKDSDSFLINWFKGE